MTLQRYVIDTSSLLNTWLYDLPIDIAPRLWEQLDSIIDEGRLIAPIDVLVELERKDDGIHDWAKQRRDRLFVDVDAEELGAVKRIANDERFRGLIKNRPARNRADPVVVAMAQVRGCVVVTQEQDDGSAGKCRIPYVCRTLDVPFLNLVGLMRAESWVL